MKLRIKGNAVRVRLDRRDLNDLLNNGYVEDSVNFGRDVRQRFAYAVEIDTAHRGQPRVDYLDGRMRIQIGRQEAETWAGSDLVGFENEQSTQTGCVRLMLEKDFACLDRPAGEEADDAFAFPNPSMICSRSASLNLR